MGFSPPTFNLTCNIWRRASVVGGPLPPPAADVVSQCNLSFARNRQVQTAFQSVSGKYTAYVSVELLLPARTDVRGHFASTAVWDGDLIEVPAGTGRYYTCHFVEDVGRGFLNEYRLALLLQLSSEIITLTESTWGSYAWPRPTP